MVLSVAVKQGLFSMAIIDKGIVKVKETKSLVVDKEKPTIFDNLIEASRQAMVKLKGYVDEHSDIEEVVFEMNNSTIKKWIDSSYSTEDYNAEFSALLELMDSIPVKFLYAVVSKPQAVHFLDKKYIKKSKVSGFDALGFDDMEG